MKKLKKRLPALLMALILAVMPVLMAVPARADVLTGAQSSFIHLDQGVVSFNIGLPDGFDYKYFAVFDTTSYGQGLVLLASNSSTKISRFVSTSSDYVRFGPSSYGLNALKNYSCVFYVFTESGFDENTSFILGAWSDPVTITGSYMFEPASVVDYIYATPNINLVGDFSGMILEGGLQGVRFGGIFSVFSGVASFLAGAVSSASTMFYTAEGGLSVFGILAVASLGLAVILLLMSLIAGWLKFK